MIIVSIEEAKLEKRMKSSVAILSLRSPQSSSLHGSAA